ncbi:9196_t:CDS:2, partial [Funneliformis mosseae]
RLIGDAAKNQVNMNPYDTVFNVKQLIGRNFRDERLKSSNKSAVEIAATAAAIAMV